MSTAKKNAISTMEEYKKLITNKPKRPKVNKKSVSKKEEWSSLGKKATATAVDVARTKLKPKR
jgi:hypothetical protein